MSSSSSSYPSPTRGASLLLAFKSHPNDSERKTVLVIGANRLAAVRTFSALEAGFDVVVAAELGAKDRGEVEPEISWRVLHAQIAWRDLPPTPLSLSEGAAAFDAFLEGIPRLALVCVTDTLLSSSSATGAGKRRRSRESAALIASACRKRHVPVNVSDEPTLCDFTFPATHRFTSASTSASASALQVAVTSNGKACRLASRIKREIVLALPKDVGAAVDNVGQMRELAAAAEDEEDGSLRADVNAPVEQLKREEGESEGERQQRRMRWIAQLSEFWPIDRLGRMTEQEMRDALEKEKDRRIANDASAASGGCPRRRQIASPNDGHPPAAAASLSPAMSRHGIDVMRDTEADSKKQGKILLVGSGPGHPALLTVAARRALVELGTVILSDKLVPSQVLDLIPKERTLYIAKKFPGNAEGAQNELMEMAVEAAARGETVVRLKQGDPFLYGRGGEEVLYFRQRGYEAIVIPGVSSALAGPLMAGIPVTQRGVAESLTICTGVGRQGRDVELPPYERARSLVVLMGVARLPALRAALVETKGYPPELPIAVIERASCPDQRVVCATLESVEEAMRNVGEQRPPSMMFVGWAALALAGTRGDLLVLDDAAASLDSESLREKDAKRVAEWLGNGGGNGKWMVQEGLPAAVDWDGLA